MIFTSPHPTITIPEFPLTDFVLQRAAEFGDKPAIIEGQTGRTINYTQLASLIRRLAAGLSDLGLRKGDVLAIYSPNLPEFAITFHAVVLLGGVVTMVPPLFSDSEIKTQLRDSAAKFLLTVSQLGDKAQEAAADAGIKNIIVVGESDVGIPFASLLTNHKKPAIPEIDPDEDLAALPYSSGTTGFPKGVMLTHRNLVSMLCQIQSTDTLTEDDTMVCVVPMYHLYGLHVVMNWALWQGATVVTLPRYDLNQFLAVLQKYQVSVAPLVPPLVLALARAAEVDDYDLSDLQTVLCGAAALPQNVAQEFHERLGCQIKYGYGLTEVSPLSHASGPLRPDKPGSVGYCLPNTECKIVAPETGVELATNQEGEIWIRGPQVMRGYLGNPQATSEMIDEHGWLRSGDIGYVDEEGLLFVVDRLKELIKYKGRQVAPAELEAVLLSHPAVADAGVIPYPDEEAGEVPKAFVVLKSAASAAEIMDFVAQRVSPHKRIRQLEFVDEIPKSPAGKILRRILIQRDAASSQPQ
jgi:acyl-CoA synthetase (AMP-forming)/AMP-acid ligase II